MLERVIENWLDKADERSLQLAFAHMLSAEGYTVIHISRHCGMEMGKDIIAIAPDEVPCAYQLKAAHGGKITLKQWRNEISGQVEDLVLGAIDHPSVDSEAIHRSYLVTNGKIEEELSRAIQDRNRGWQKQGYKLITIVKWQLLKKVEKLSRGLWPPSIKLICDLSTIDPRGALPKIKLIEMFETILPFDLKDIGKSPSKIDCGRALATVASLCAIVTSPLYKENNHVAIIEAWTLFAAYAIALATRWKLPSKYWKNELNIALESIYHSLENLCEELRSVGFSTGEHPLEQPFNRVRVTWLISLMSIYALWRREKLKSETKEKKKGLDKDEFENWKRGEEERDEFIRDFCLNHSHEMALWGEAAIPQWITWFWFAVKIDPTPVSDRILRDVIRVLCDLNRPRSINALPSPYYDAADVLSRNLGIADEPLEDSFDGTSYALESLVHLFVRRNWKEELKNLWPDITRITLASFESKRKSDFFRWWVLEGNIKMVFPKHTQEWQELKNKANECQGECLAQIAKKYPFFVLLFISVFPHRMNVEIMRWLDTQLKAI